MEVIMRSYFESRKKKLNQKKYKIKEDITHQGIGGKEFIIEEEWDIDDVILKGLFYGNPACRNFLDRRGDEPLGVTRPRTFYGKVGILGYVVAEDELEEIQ